MLVASGVDSVYDANFQVVIVSNRPQPGATVVSDLFPSADGQYSSEARHLNEI